MSPKKSWKQECQRLQQELSKQHADILDAWLSRWAEGTDHARSDHLLILIGKLVVETASRGESVEILQFPDDDGTMSLWSVLAGKRQSMALTLDGALRLALGVKNKKRCRVCLRLKPLEVFSKGKPTGVNPLGHGSTCKPCECVRVSKYAAEKAKHKTQSTAISVASSKPARNPKDGNQAPQTRTVRATNGPRKA